MLCGQRHSVGKARLTGQAHSLPVSAKAPDESSPASFD